MLLLVLCFIAARDAAALHPVLHVAPAARPVSRIQVQGSGTLLWRGVFPELIACTAWAGEKRSTVPGCGVRTDDCHCCYPVLASYACDPPDACRPSLTGPQFGECVDLFPGIQSFEAELVPVGIVRPQAHIQFFSRLYPNATASTACQHATSGGACAGAQTLRVKFASLVS